MKISITPLPSGRVILVVEVEGKGARGTVCASRAIALDHVRMMLIGVAIAGFEELERIEPEPCPICRAHARMPCTDGDQITHTHAARIFDLL